MAKLPQELPWNDADNKWASILNPIVANPIVNSLILKDVVLAAGDNIINHRLGRKLQGYIVIGINAAATIYDKQSTNQMPQLTLVLNSSAPATAQILVF